MDWQTDAMAGIRDVAKAAGVSTATVSRALRGLPHVTGHTRELILEHAAALGYVPSSSAAGLATGRTMAVSVVVPRVDGWFCSSVLDGVGGELRQAGYDVVLVSIGDDGDERDRLFREAILRRRSDAIVALCADLTDDEHEALQAAAVPSVVVGAPARDVRSVGVDEVALARTATQHLLDLGHRDILFIGGEPHDGRGARVPHERRVGYERALRAAGVPVDARPPLEGEFSTAVARRRMNELLDGRGAPPTAVLAASDEMAVGAMLAIADHGLRVPADISVVGVDDHPSAAMFGLTTMAQDPRRQGAMAARVVLDQLEGRRTAKRAVRLPVLLVKRSSTSAPNPQVRLPAAGAGPDAHDDGTRPHAQLAVLTPATAGWYAGSVVDGITRFAREVGAEVVIQSAGTGPTIPPLTSLLPDPARFASIVFVEAAPEPADVETIARLGIRAVSVGGVVPGLIAVAADDAAAARVATEHLLSLGHTDIAHLTGATGHGLSPQALRLEGFRAALRDAGLDPRGRDHHTDPTAVGGYREARLLLGDPRRRPTAVFAASDELAFGALHAAQELGIRVPSDLSVVGFGGHPAGEAFGLTTIDVHPQEQGHRAAETAVAASALGLGRVHSPDPLSFGLLVRTSTTAPGRADWRRAGDDVVVENL